MKIFKRLRLLGNVLDNITYIEDVRIVRISPRSFYQGERIGFYSGLAIGFVVGIMFICLALGVL